MYQVVIVDDEPAVTRGLAAHVDWASLDMEVAATALCAEDALSYLATHTVHLLITDVCMRRMDGLAVIAKARQANPSLRCIVISAHGNFEYVKRALQLGAENYLLKPISQEELHDTLVKTLENLNQGSRGDSPRFDIRVFRDNILNRWATGSLGEFELQERAELANIDLRAASYLVCLLRMSRIATGGSRLEAAALLLHICESTISAALGGECFIDDWFDVVVLLHGVSLEEQRPHLDRLLLEVIRRASDEGVGVFASVWQLLHDSHNVPLGYESALFWCNSGLLNPSMSVAYPDGISSHDSAYCETQPTLRQFERALMDGSAIRAQTSAIEFCRRISELTGCRAKSAGQVLALTMIKVFLGSRKSWEKIPAQLAAQLSMFEDLEEVNVEGWIRATIARGAEVIAATRKSQHHLVRLALEQIHTRYREGMSLKTLASGFKVNAAYLGQLFKSETGSLFTEYLTRFRLDASRALLLETDQRIGEITSRVGMPNQSYFTRLFKRAYGMSPLAFRRHYRQE